MQTVSAHSNYNHANSPTVTKPSCTVPRPRLTLTHEFISTKQKMGLPARCPSDSMSQLWSRYKNRDDRYLDSNIHYRVTYKKQWNKGTEKHLKMSEVCTKRCLFLGQGLREMRAIHAIPAPEMYTSEYTCNFQPQSCFFSLIHTSYSTYLFRVQNTCRTERVAEGFVHSLGDTLFTRGFGVN